MWLLQVNSPIMVKMHPLFASNGILVDLGVWNEWPIAYRYLMHLGQDLSYTLPRSIAPAAAGHLLMGSIALLLGRLVGRS